MKTQYVHRVFVRVPGAKRGVAVFDFILGGFNAAAGTTWFVPLYKSVEFFEVCANFPSGSLFRIKEVKLEISK